jgi:hypothetical protein
MTMDMAVQIAELQHEVTELRTKLKDSEAGAAAMRKAVLASEWAVYRGDDPLNVCPSCLNRKSQGHNARCKIGPALSTTAGAALLERVRELERCLEWAVDQLDVEGLEHCAFCLQDSGHESGCYYEKTQKALLQ